MKTNLAHASKLQGKIDEARLVYLSNRGVSTSDGDSHWEKNKLEDLEKIRATGIDHPVMAEIETLFASEKSR